MKRIIVFVSVLALLLTLLPGISGSARAYEIPQDFTGMTLESVISEFVASHKLKDTTFAISYYNTVTGESYAWNDTWFSIAASTYKLPLNMYFYEMQQAGELSGDTIISWTGQTLDFIHEQSIVHSNNEYSEALMWYWGDHVTYKQNMRKYFTMDDAEIHPSYWQANWFCVRMMMDTLKYLYEHQENFEELIGYMKQAKPGEYFKRGVTDYEVAHKYGAVQIYHNDVGIIYTPQPYLLAVYTAGVVGESICAEAAKLLTAYTVWQGEQNPVEPEEEEVQVEGAQEEETETTGVELVLEEVELPEKVVEESPAEEPVVEEPIAEIGAEEPAAVPAVPVEQPVKKPSVVPLLLGGGFLILALIFFGIWKSTNRRR